MDNPIKQNRTLACCTVMFGLITLSIPGLSAVMIISEDIWVGTTLAMHQTKCSSNDAKPVIKKHHISMKSRRV